MFSFRITHSSFRIEFHHPVPNPNLRDDVLGVGWVFFDFARAMINMARMKIRIRFSLLSPMCSKKRLEQHRRGENARGDEEVLPGLFMRVEAQLAILGLWRM